MKKFYSHGKLLISGEYLVLKGATALTAPLNFGQSLEIFPSENKNFIWESYVYDKLWFEAEIDPENYKILKTNDHIVAQRLINILKQVDKLNIDFCKNYKNTKVISSADFDIRWGLGSSSSLISNISYWVNIDPFVLNRSVSKGSGYDVICTRQDGPVFFNKTRQSYFVERVDFKPEYSGQIFFVYIGNKQDSAKSVDQFYSRKKRFTNEIQLISDLSKHIAYSTNITDFKYFIKEHEYIISSVLKKKMLKEERFRDFQGEIKSLGAWGGDFAMVTWEGTKRELTKYFEKKYITVIFQFNELIKTW